MRLEGVGRRYGPRGPWVLRDVHLDLPGGALLRIEGANGSGKSTLLRLCAGLDRPSTGRITGRPRTAYVPERFPAALPFTALGYLTHLGRIHGLRGPVATRRALGWLDRFGAAGHARTPLTDLSKGTGQKVAVVQALVAEPELLVLDEAWTGLDVPAREVLDRAVAERLASGGTVVYVDHDPARLAAAAPARHRVADGRLLPEEGAAPTARPAPGEAVPHVVIEVEGASFTQGPSGTAAVRAADVQVGQRDVGVRELPGAPVVESGPAGAARLTVAAVHSDALLRALLTARPPWHIRSVGPARPAPPRPPAGAIPDATTCPVSAPHPPEAAPS